MLWTLLPGAPSLRSSLFWSRLRSRWIICTVSVFRLLSIGIPQGARPADIRLSPASHHAASTIAATCAPLTGIASAFRCPTFSAVLFPRQCRECSRRRIFATMPEARALAAKLREPSLVAPGGDSPTNRNEPSGPCIALRELWFGSKNRGHCEAAHTRWEIDKIFLASPQGCIRSMRTVEGAKPVDGERVEGRA